VLSFSFFEKNFDSLQDPEFFSPHRTLRQQVGFTMDLVDSTDAEIEKLSNELLKSAMKRMDPLLQQTAAMKAEVLEDMARASSEECLLIEKERNFLLAQTASLSDAGEDSNAVGEKEDLPSTEELRARMQSSLDEAMFQLRNQSKERLAALQTQVHEASTSLQEQLRSVSAELADQLDKLHEETAAAASGVTDDGAISGDSASEMLLRARGGYDGETDDSGRRHGRGSCRFLSGASYQGQWVAGEMSGYGTFKYASGAEYSGTWKANMREGDEGTFTFGAAEDGRYVGSWKNDDLDGHGTLTYPNGGVFEGTFRKGQREGPGRMRTTEGDVLEGQWVADKKEGEFQIRYAAGGSFCGRYCFV
jgi:hypothetical protein